MFSSDTAFRLLSHPGKLLLTHSTQVLANGDTYLDRRSLTEPLRHAVRLALIMHDLGKATTFFQEYVQGKHGKSGSALGYLKNHARLSALWAWRFAVDRWGETDPLPWLIFHAVLKHHGNLGNLSQLVRLPPDLAEPLPGVVIDDDNEDEPYVLAYLQRMSEHLDYTEFGAILVANGFAVTRFDHEHFMEIVTLFYGSYRRGIEKKWKAAAKQIEQVHHQDALGLFFAQSFIFSVLLTCDKGECLFNGPIYQSPHPKFPGDTIDRYKLAVFAGAKGRLNEMREQVYREVADQIPSLDLTHQRFYSINLPTGLGKTLCVLNAGMRLLQYQPSLRKIVYCLPFTSVIDQVGRIARDILATVDLPDHSGNLILLHHLAELHYCDGTDDNEFENYQGEFLINQLEANLTITTFFQLLHGTLTHRNRDIRKFAALADSVIILDEVQNIPVKYWGLVRELFTLLAKRLNCVFLLMTATMPMIFDAAEGQIQELVKDPRAVFQQLNRITLDCSLLNQPFALSQLKGGLAPCGDNEFCDYLEGEIVRHVARGMLVIVNTRAIARVVYREMKRRFPDLHWVFLSSDVTPHDRLARIEDIKARGGKNLVVISTQLVEAGVDIDLGRVYRQRAPLDAVLQASGRCNRNNGTMGRVVLFRLCGKTASGKRRDLGESIYSDLAMQATHKVLADAGELKESAFYDCARAYFQEIKKYSSVAETRDLCAALNRLDYTGAFDTGECTNSFPPIEPFRLIEEQNTQSYLVMQNSEAQQLLADYRRVGKRKVDRYQMVWDRKEILRALAPFTVSARREPNEGKPRKTENFFEIVYPEAGGGSGAARYVYDPEVGLVSRQDGSH